MVSRHEDGWVSSMRWPLYGRVSLLIAAICSVATLIAYFALDLMLARYFDALRGTPGVELAEWVTMLGVSTPYLAAGLLLWLLFRRRASAWARHGLYLFVTVALSGILVNLLKLLFGRARPKLWFEEQVYGFEWLKYGYDYASFPSGHSATALGATVALGLIWPRYRMVLVTIGIVVALSRVVLTAHYLGDTIIGGMIGAVTSLLLYAVLYPQKGYVDAS
jgi:membrane-associated phospholipid phosphatase